MRPRSRRRSRLKAAEHASWWKSEESTLEESSAHGAGWQVHMEDLGTYLSGGEPTSWRTRWVELTPAYEDLSHGLE
jgi:hypothetical protein